MFKNLSVAALLAVGVTAQYTPNPNIVFDANLNCTACIRGGFDYCIYGLGAVGSLGKTWTCNKEVQNPNF
jgi:hypothetical protein